MKSLLTLALVGCLFTLNSIAAEDPALKQKQEQNSPVGPTAGLSGDTYLNYAQLSDDDRRLLKQGEISQPQLLAGGFLGTVIGFGTGHLPYQMWRERGWIFTAGEPAALALAILGATGINNDCTRYSNRLECDDVGGSRAALVIGVLGFVGLRIWEVIDVWTIPSARNYEIRAIRQKMGRELTETKWSISPVAYRPKGETKTIPGLAFRLVF